MSELCHLCQRVLPTFIVWKPNEPKPVSWHWTNIERNAGRSSPFMKPVCDLCEPPPDIIFEVLWGG